MFKPQSEWTAEDYARIEAQERAENYGMTWLEWCKFVETHTGSEVNRFQYEYCKAHGKKWPQGPNTRENDDGGLVLYGPANPNNLGKNEGKVHRRN